jgi:hypothetical protein
MEVARCQSCTGGKRLMCDTVFASTADHINLTSGILAENIESVENVSDMMDFSAASQGMAFAGLTHQLKGFMGLDCQLTDEQIAVRLRTTQEFRNEAE